MLVGRARRAFVCLPRDGMGWDGIMGDQRERESGLCARTQEAHAGASRPLWHGLCRLRFYLCCANRSIIM